MGDRYYQRYQDVVNQINTENALAEQIRQYNESMAYQKERDAVADNQWKAQYELSKRASSSKGSGGSKSSRSSKGSNFSDGKSSSGTSSKINTENDGYVYDGVKISDIGNGIYKGEVNGKLYTLNVNPNDSNEVKQQELEKWVKRIKAT